MDLMDWIPPAAPPKIEILMDGDMPTYAIVVAEGAYRTMAFHVYESGRRQVPDGTPLYQVAGASGMEVTADLAKAEVACEGDVRWDGCVNYSVGTEDIMMHACSAKELGAFFRAVERAYAICAEALGISH